MQQKKMLVTLPDGAHLSRSRKKPGEFSPLTRDGDKNLGQVTLSDIDDEDSQEALVGALVVLVAFVAAREAAPHLKRWWSDRAFPFLEKARRRLRNDRRADDKAFPVEEYLAEHFKVPQASPTESSQEVVAALDEYRASMGSAEARERFVAALVARLFSEEQLRVLRDARIEDDGLALDLASAVETLTPQQLGESITLMLEANPSWPDDETLAELGRILERNPVAIPAAVVRESELKVWPDPSED